MWAPTWVWSSSGEQKTSHPYLVQPEMNTSSTSPLFPSLGAVVAILFHSGFQLCKSRDYVPGLLTGSTCYWDFLSKWTIKSSPWPLKIWQTWIFHFSGGALNEQNGSDAIMACLRTLGSNDELHFNPFMLCYAEFLKAVFQYFHLCLLEGFRKLGQKH